MDDVTYSKELKNDMIAAFLAKFTFDFWTVWGMIAQGLFFTRFVLQWYYSEKHKRVVIPTVFWYLSLLGAIMVIVYAIARSDIVFLITGILQIALYSRSLYISRTDEKKS